MVSAKNRNSVQRLFKDARRTDASLFSMKSGKCPMKKVNFRLLKVFFFSREAAERMSVERSLKALVHIFHPAGFSSTRHGCIWVRGGSPECLNGRWLPKKEKKNGSSLYKSRDEVSASIIPLFKQLYKILTSSIQWMRQFIGTCAHVWIGYWMSICVTGDSICWLFYVSKEGWRFKGPQCSV